MLNDIWTKSNFLSLSSPLSFSPWPQLPGNLHRLQRHGVTPLGGLKRESVQVKESFQLARVYEEIVEHHHQVCVWEIFMQHLCTRTKTFFLNIYKSYLVLNLIIIFYVIKLYSDTASIWSWVYMNHRCYCSSSNRQYYLISSNI